MPDNYAGRTVDVKCAGEESGTQAVDARHRNQLSEPLATPTLDQFGLRVQTYTVLRLLCGVLQAVLRARDQMAVGSELRTTRNDHATVAE